MPEVESNHDAQSKESQSSEDPNPVEEKASSRGVDYARLTLVPELELSCDRNR